MKKSFEEQGYKLMAIQDECFVGTENSKDAIVVLCRYEKMGKRNPIIRFDTKEFPNSDYLDKFMKQNNIKEATPSEEFKADRLTQALHLIKALPH